MQENDFSEEKKKKKKSKAPKIWNFLNKNTFES